MTSLHLTIEGLNATVEVADDQLAAVQERVDMAYADLLTDLTNLGMVVDVKRAERWVAFVEPIVRTFPPSCGRCIEGVHERCGGWVGHAHESTCACWVRGHTK